LSSSLPAAKHLCRRYNLRCIRKCYASSKNDKRESANESSEDKSTQIQEDKLSAQEDAKRAQDLGKFALQRFSTPVVDDRGLPIADALVCVSATIFFSTFILAAGLPRPSWLVPAPWVPKWRSFQYLFPAVQHGSSLAMCWTLGAVAGQAYEKAAYNDTRQEAFLRTVKSGAFATGVLIIANQILTYAIFAQNGLPPFPGETVEGDLIFARIQTELIADIALQAVSLVAWRQARWSRPMQE